MAPIKIHISTSLRPFTNNLETVDVAGGTVGECLEKLMERFPRIKEIFKNSVSGTAWVYANKERDFTRDLEKPLNDGDELTLLRKVVGG